MFAVIGTLAALHERSTSGRGQEVDVAIYEAVAALMESSMADFDVAGVVRNRSGGTLPGVAPANAYPTNDGSDVLIAGNADAVFARLCLAMGQPDLAEDDRFATHVARGENERELDGLIAEWTAGFGADELLAVLRDHAVPAGRVYTAPDMLDRPALPRSRDDRTPRLASGHRHADARCRPQVLPHPRLDQRRRSDARRAHPPPRSVSDVRPATVPGGHVRSVRSGRWSGPCTASDRSTRASG